MRHFDKAQLLSEEEVVGGPAQRACSDQTFELPTGIYAAIAIMFAGFVAILTLSFNSHMAVSFGVIAAFLAMFFGIPSLFPRLARGQTQALRWHEFRNRGIDTATGRITAGSATVLILALPFLILCFAIAISTIASVIY